MLLEYFVERRTKCVQTLHLRHIDDFAITGFIMIITIITFGTASDNIVKLTIFAFHCWQK